jgi:hypothetical protein
MTLNIGVIGDPPAPFDEQTRAKLGSLGRAIAESDCVLITERRPGIPNPLVQGARAAGGMVVVTTSARTAGDRRVASIAPPDEAEVQISSASQSGSGEAETIRSSDVIVIATASSGPALSLRAPFDEGRPIGVLTQTRHIAEAFEALIRTCAPRSKAVLVCDDDPVRLVDRLIDCHRMRLGQHGAYARTATQVTVLAERED